MGLTEVQSVVSPFSRIRCCSLRPYGLAKLQQTAAAAAPFDVQVLTAVAAAVEESGAVVAEAVTGTVAAAVAEAAAVARVVAALAVAGALFVAVESVAAVEEFVVAEVV